MKNNWQKVKLGEVAKVSGGMSFPLDSQGLTHGSVPFFKVSDMNTTGNEVLMKTSNNYVGKEFTHKIFSKYSVIFPKVGGAIATNKKRVLALDSLVDNNIMVVTPLNMNYEYLYYYFLTLDLTSLSVGTALPALQQKVISDLEIPLPPLDEQKRIVEKIKTVFSKIESAENEVAETAEKLTRTLPEAYLRNQDNELTELEEFLDEGVARIGAEWKNCKLVGVSNEKGIVELRTNKTTGFNKYKKVVKGDFVYNPMRVNIGSIALYDSEEPAITSPDYVVFRIKDKLSASLLLYYLKSSHGIAEINHNTQGSVRSRLYFRNLVKIKFPFSESIDYTAIEASLAKVNIAVAYANSVSEANNNLKQSILIKAFKGELM